MIIQDMLVDTSVSVIEAVAKMNGNGYGIVFVCDRDILKGVFSDGDFRRYILKGGDTNKQIKEIANFNPLYLKAEQQYNSIQFMKEHKITALPVVDKKGRIIRIDVASGHTIYNSVLEDVPVVIMAGGKGTRLAPYTNVLPKPLIPIDDHTITEHIIEQFEQVGCKHFYMIVNYKKELIKAFFKESNRKNEITFIDELQFMGTGGGIKLLGDTIDTTFFLSNCDILIQDDYRSMLEFHKEKNNIITMIAAVTKVEIPYGTMDITEDGQVLALKEKPKYEFITNTGLYIIEPEFLQCIPEGEFIHITDVIEDCIKQGKKVGAYTISEEAWMDMGQIEELNIMKRKLKDN